MRCCVMLRNPETPATASTQRYFAAANWMDEAWPPLELRSFLGQSDMRGLPDWMTSARIVHNVLRLGESHIQLIALYCRPATGQQASLFNQLMDVALAQAKLIPLPLVMGDLNATDASKTFLPGGQRVSPWAPAGRLSFAK